MSDTEKAGLFAKMIGDKRRWRAYKARTKQFPGAYRTAIDAVERYTMYTGGPDDADSLMRMFEDLADLFEQAAADGTPIREIVGEDPVEFVQTFVSNYQTPGWIARERKRLTDTIERLERDEAGR
jgi:DNA-binding ferritin-like protein (Dps family)